MKKFFRQPNGKYCYFTYNGIGGFDLTEEDIIKLFVEEAKEEAEGAIQGAKNFGAIIEELLYRDSKHQDEWLQYIGFTEPYENLVKYVPREPLDKNYVHHDFTTYGKCPSCGNRVCVVMADEEEQCSCGQRLKWN